MRGRSTLLAAVLAAASFAGLAHMPTIVQSEPSRPAARKRITPHGYANAITSRKTGPGWSARQVQRMAKKKRNRARNRAAHRRSQS